MTDNIIFGADKDRAVLDVILARSEKRNALTFDMLTALLRRLQETRRDGSTRVVLLRGEGSCFCSGSDLSEALSEEPLRGARIETLDALGIALAPQERRRGFATPRLVQEVLKTLRQLPQIVVGRAQGASRGGGVGLLTSCDVVVASEDFTGGFMETRRGFFPTLLFPFLRRAYPLAKLREHILTAEPFDAAAAKELGIVHRVVPNERLDEEVEKVVARLLRNDPIALAKAKSLATKETLPDDEEIERGWKEHCRAQASERGREGIAAFLQKREPKWSAPRWEELR